MSNDASVTTTIAPWLSVPSTARAVAFYRSAFGATENYRLEDPDGNAVVRLSIDGAELWVSDAGTGKPYNEPVGGNTMRLILTVSNPDETFEKAVQSGATVVFPVGEEHGWRLGRVADPFGLHWEIGKQLDS
jgi:PhnB protein